MTLLPKLDPPEVTDAEMAQLACTELKAAIKHLEEALGILDEAGWSEGPRSKDTWTPLCHATDKIEAALKALEAELR